MFDQTPTNAPYGMPNMGGYQYNGFQQAPAKVMNVLTEAEINELKANTNQFSLQLTQRESLQAACNHRSPDGQSDTLVFDSETGIARCTICGYEFRPIDMDADANTIKDAADKLVDILQTIKILYTDIPASASREYFQIIPLIAKVPQLFEFAVKNFNKHEFNAWSYNNHNMGGVAMFNNLSNMFGAGYAAPQQPYGYAPQQGYPQQQPMGMGMGMAPQQPMGNPFGYPGASQAQGYVPQTQGFQYQPAPNAPVAPTVQAPAVNGTVVDAATPDTTVTQTVTV